MPLPVSITIVTYNSAATIGRCLASVLATMRRGDDVVIVDNNSRDATLEIVASLTSELAPGSVKIIANPINRGFSIATNQGIRATAAPFILLLNPDTIVTSNWLEHMAAHFIMDEVGAVGPVSNFAAGRQSVLPHWRDGFEGSIGPEEAAGLLYRCNRGTGEFTCLLIGFCLMLRRDVVERLGGLDERLFLGNDDLELSWRLRLHNYKLRIATDVFIYHEGQHSFRGEPESLTNRLVQESSDALYRILEAHYGPDRVPTPQELWGIDWFVPSYGYFNPLVRFHQALTLPSPRYCRTDSKDHPLVSIIILTFNQRRHTEECLLALERYTCEPYEVILVDNGSSDGTVAWIESRSAGNPRYRLIRNSENRGFAAGCNQGMALAQGDYLVLLNNDVVVTPEWLTGLIECQRAEPLAGIVGPLTDNASGIQGLGNIVHGDLDSFARSFRSRHRYQRIPSRRLVGFCMLFSRCLYREIGGLDERFGTGNFEDDDLCLRSAIAGYRNLIAGDVFVRHYGSVSFKGAGIDYRASINGNWSRFREKWSSPVGDEATALRIAACRAREDAERLLLDDRLDEALAMLVDACRKYDGDMLLRDILCSTLQESGRYDEALYLTTPDSATGLTIRARSLLAAGRDAEAESLLVSAAAADPGAGSGYFLRGMMARQRGEEEFATALMSKGFQLAPATRDSSAAIRQMLDSPVVPHMHTMLREASQLYPSSRRLALCHVELSSRSSEKQEVLAAAEHFIEHFGPDDRILELGIEARRSCGPWRPTAPTGRSVSLCMIVRDEERHIVRCLASCKPLVHEMVVVDTGSRDRTAALAELLGARILHHRWQDDFAQARNVSLEAAQGDWILVMDGDEALSRQDYPIFQKILNEATSPAAFCMVTRNYSNLTALEEFVPLDGSYPKDESGTGWTPSRKVRLFPNHYGIRFEGVVHEMVEGTISCVCLPMREHPVPVHHYGGLEKERLDRKRVLYYTLGRRKLLMGNRDSKALYELAVQAGELGNYTEAEGFWLALLEKEPEFAVAWFNLGYLYLRMKRPKDALTATEQALALKPGYQAALINLSLCRFCLLPPQEALSAVEEIAGSCAADLSVQVLKYVTICLIGRIEEGVSGLRTMAAQGYGMTDYLHSTATLLRSAGRPAEGDILDTLAKVVA